MTNSFYYFWTVLFGLIIGSFLNVVILRDTNRKSILNDRSRCPHCNHVLAWYDLFPVLSYVALGGKCRYCKTGISWQYPAVEISMAVLAVFSVWYGFIQNGSWWLTAGLLVIMALLLAISVIDIRTQEVPLEYCVAIAIIGAATMIFCHQLSWQQSLVGGLIGIGLIGAVIIVWKLITRENGMGVGDIWILGAIGFVVGFPQTLVTFMAAIFLGAIIGSLSIMQSGKGGLKTAIPFGPFLSLGMVIALLWGPSIVNWYILGL
jgi:leader peptidase (prepilin peptidase)/N-methyltransferase